jgi:HSP90 family molecular chaperone
MHKRHAPAVYQQHTKPVSTAMHIFTTQLFGINEVGWIVGLISLAVVVLLLLYLFQNKPKKRSNVVPTPTPKKYSKTKREVTVAPENIQDSAAQLEGDIPVVQRIPIEKEKFAAGTPVINKPSIKPVRTYHAFISYGRKDELEVKSIYDHLTDNGLKVWLDIESIKPGDDWMESMQAGLENSRACLVFYRDEPNVWQQEETKQAIRKRAKDPTFKVIPVLLPGVQETEPPLPPFLQGTNWVDLRNGLLNLKALKRLVEAIRDVGIVPIHQVPDDSQTDSDLPTGYKADVKKIIDLLIGDALYSRRDVSIRELIQNAVDACERLSDSKFGGATRTEITINIDTKEGYFEVIDNGDGMSPEVLSEYFAVVGRSIRDEENIMERAQGDEKTRSHLIGKFGIGFISAYMLAKQIFLSTTCDGHPQINLEIKGISEPFVYYDTSKVGRAPDEIGTTIRVYLKDSFRADGPNPLDITAAIQEFCRHVQYINVFQDGARVTIPDIWNTKTLRTVEVTNVPFRFELRLGISEGGEDFFASNAGFLISRTSDPISPVFMPIHVGGEINFYPGTVDLNMARDRIVLNDKSIYVRRLIAKATKNLLIKVASGGNEKERKVLRGILAIYLERALELEEKGRADSGSMLGLASSHSAAVEPEGPPLSSVESAELLMDVMDVEIGEITTSLREALGTMKEDGKNRVYIRRHYLKHDPLLNVIEQSLKKRGFALIELDAPSIEFKSGKRSYSNDRKALEFLAKRYYFDVYEVQKPFSADIEDLIVGKEVLSPAMKRVINEIESKTGRSVHLSRLKGAPVVFQLSGENYLNVGSNLLTKALASSSSYDKSIVKSYILGLLQYEIH